MKINFGFLSKFSALIILLTLLITANSCKHHPPGIESLSPSTTPTPIDTTTGNQEPKPCSPDTVYFNNTILPLFNSSCAKAGCHDAITHAEGFVFNSYANIMASGEITPGAPNQGDIMEVIQETDPNKIMPPPPSSALTVQQISMISTWISQGAQNNYCNSCDTNNVSYNSKVKAILDLKCKGCHNPNLVSGGVDLSTYSSVVAASQTGALLGSVKHQAPFKSMPQGGQKIPACEINILSIWINNNYPQ